MLSYASQAQLPQDHWLKQALGSQVSAVNDMLPAQFQLPQNKLPACAEPSFNANLYLIMGVFKLLESLLSWRSLVVVLLASQVWLT